MIIGEIAKKTGVNESTLRYYEKKELIRVPRDKNGRRDFAESDIEWIKFIKRLKDTGMLLKDIKRYSQLRYEGDGTMAERLSILETHRLFVLREIKKWDEYLKNLDEKITFYKSHS